MQIPIIKNTIFYLLAFGLVIISIASCATYYFRSQYMAANKMMHESKNLETKPFLKAHLRNGDVCILKDSWDIDTIGNVVIGTGIRYDFNRQKIHEGTISISIDSVAIFETNKKLLDTESDRVTALSILAGLDAAVTGLCIANPKACFGSCPTFYINSEDNFHYADAEGFSNAISPSMEYYDIDALDNSQLMQNSFSLTMKNEAQETHCVNNIKLLAFPRNENSRIYQTPENKFYRCQNIYNISQATGEEGNIDCWLNVQDHQERFSLSDIDDLNSKEEIYLSFDNINNDRNLGLIINFRQTLMTTYLFYSSMGYMGDEVGDIFAYLEKNPSVRDRFVATTQLLGGIEVYLLDKRKGTWEFQNTLNETGPIAINKQFIPLKEVGQGSGIEIKLVLNRGLWRLDYTALTNIIEPVKPIEISSHLILNKGVQDNAALAKVNSAENYLISMPGSEYRFEFMLPEQDADYELFLYSKGYYLEWMRSNWIKDKNLIKLKQMVDYPRMFLRSEAADFKMYEGIMEDQFWNSRIDTKTFSFYEN